MNIQELFATVDRLQAEYLDILEHICNIESPTHHKAGIDAVGCFIADLARRKGWQVERCQQEVAGDVLCITMNTDSTEAPLCVSGHMDTVFPLGMFGTPAVRRDEENMYGPGVTDCKGGIVVGLLAMDALHQCGYRNRPIRLLLQSDEETGSLNSKKATIRYICERAKDAIAFLNLEGIARPNTAVMWRKGILRCRVTVKGIAVHSSQCERGANAIAEAAHKILLLEEMKDPDGVTCNCGVINGGTVANTVPDTCTFVADIRYATDEQLAATRQRLHEVAELSHIPGCTCTVEEVSSRPSMPRCDRNTALLDRINEFFVQNGITPLTARGAGGGSDAAYITQCGIPCVDNMGTEGGKIHSEGEYMRLNSLGEAAKKVAIVAVQI